MNDSTPVYTTVTGEAPKSTLSRTLKVVDNNPAPRIVKPRTKKHTPVLSRRTPLDKHIKPEKMVMDAAKRLVAGKPVDGKQFPPGYYSRIEPVANDIVIVR